MKIGIMSIGDELLTGRTINTNLTFLGQRLSQRGIDVTCQMTVPDQEEDIHNALNYLYQNVNFVICSGGLGITTDDITKRVIAKYFDLPLVVNKDCQRNLEERFSLHNFDFAAASTFLEGADIIYNEGGYAPGFYVNQGGNEFVALPGVPAQLKKMFVNGVESKYFPGANSAMKSYHFFGISEHIIDNTLKGCEEKGISYGLYSGIYTVTVVVYGGFSPAIEKKLKEFQDNEFDDKELAKAVHNKLIRQEKTMVIAESCTGGALSYSFTAFADASKYLKGSYVVYSDDAKERMLGVAPKTLEQHSAVSEQVIDELLDGLGEGHKDTNVRIAVSGIAGPGGGTKKTPVGTVYMGIEVDGERVVGKVPMRRLHADRQHVMELSCYYILGQLWQMLR